jgi:hypothetical protein
MNNIRIGRPVVGFICLRSEPYPWGDAECMPLLGPPQQLPQETKAPPLTLKERVRNAVARIKERTE